MDEGEEGEVGDEVAYDDGDESEADGRGTEVPLFVDRVEGFDTSEDEGVREAGEEGEAEHNGFTDEHFKGTHPCDENFFEGEAVFLEFVGAVDVGLASFATLLGQSIEHYGGPGFRDEEEM